MSDSSSDPHWSNSVIPKIVNIIAYTLFSGWHAYFAYDGMYDAGAGKITYITPAPWAFLIWPAIHLLLLGTVIYQFTENGRRIIVEGASWRFFMLMAFNGLYVYLWAHHEYLLAFLVSIVVYSLVSSIYDVVVNLQQEGLVAADEIFIYTPFSLYYDWTVILIYLSGFSAFGIDASTDSAGAGTKACVFLTLFVLNGSCGVRGGLCGAITIAWYLWAVFVYQTSSGFVHESVLVFAVLASSWAAFTLIASVAMVLVDPRSLQEDEESTSLLGS
ncbi:hypothetical protein BDY19DRAFT_995986 [Irpex rosettiformis]|uniref:Uncharacterized protein n=1 Tax=Irpex rosettiformis TaxID=378272 RepID=A0ACB8TX41_9APHY|nr:hypothetical protein BDY19DRAFT_995986 [Irpex rosettiformis]